MNARKHPKRPVRPPADTERNSPPSPDAVMQAAIADFHAELDRERARISAQFREIESALLTEARQILDTLARETATPDPPPPSSPPVAAESPQQAATRLAREAAATVERQITELMRGTQAIVERANAHCVDERHSDAMPPPMRSG